MRYFIEGCTDLYRLSNGTLTGVRYQDETVVPGPTVRPYTGAVGPRIMKVPGLMFNQCQVHHFYPLICRVQVKGSSMVIR